MVQTYSMVSVAHSFAQSSGHWSLIALNHLYLCICVLLFSVLVKVYYVKKKRDSIFAKLPGPREWPLIGNLWLIWGKSESINASSLSTLFALSKEYRKEGLFRFSTGLGKRVVVLFAPSTVEPFLASDVHLPKGSSYRFHHHFLGNSLFLKEGGEFKRTRKLWVPVFNNKRLEAMPPLINRSVQIMCQKVKETPESADILRLIDTCTLDIMVETATGRQLNALQSKETHMYLKASEGYSQLYPLRLYFPWLWSDFIYNQTSQGKQMKRHIEVMHEFVSDMIERRKQVYINNNWDEDESKVSNNFLDILLDYHLRENLLDELEVRREMDMNIFASVETTATVIRFVVYCLGLYPDIQQQVVNELGSIFDQDNERDATVDDIKRMTLLEYVINETLRLYPVIPTITRETTHDEVVEGHFIPRGTTVAIFWYGLHRNEDVFPGADTFEPMRWSPEKSTGRSPYAFGGFSAGTRSCVGQRMAMIQFKIILSTILRQFEIKSLEPMENITIDGGMTLNTSTPIKVSLKPRQFRD